METREQLELRFNSCIKDYLMWKNYQDTDHTIFTDVYRDKHYRAKRRRKMETLWKEIKRIDNILSK